MTVVKVENDDASIAAMRERVCDAHFAASQGGESWMAVVPHESGVFLVAGSDLLEVVRFVHEEYGLGVVDAVDVYKVVTKQ